MTVTALVTRNDITATASQTSFTYTFRVLAATDMDVYQNGVLLSSGYTVNDVGNTTGGTVVLDSGVPVGQIVSLVLAMPLDRTTNYQNSGKFLADDVNEDFDKIYIGAVQNENEGGRSLRLKDVEPPTVGVDMTIPLKDDRKGKFLAFDSTTGGPIATTGSSLYDAASWIAYNFTGNSSTTAFTLGSDPASENNTQVYIDGVYQQKDGYSVSGTVLTFSVAPPNLSTIEVMVASILPIGSTSSDLVSYTPAGTGAVATTVQAKLRESVSVKDFGAVGNGSTNDTAAIQAAIDSVSTSGGQVHFPTGTYNCSTLVITGGANNILITGSGKGDTSINFTGSSGVGLDVKETTGEGGVQRLTIRDISFTDSRSTSPLSALVSIRGGGTGATPSLTTGYISLENIGVGQYETSTGKCFHFTNLSHVSMRSLAMPYAVDCKYGIYIDTDTSINTGVMTFDECYITGGETALFLGGTELMDSYSFTGCFFGNRGATTNTMKNVIIFDASSAQLGAINFTANHVEMGGDATHAGVLFESNGSRELMGISFTANHISANTGTSKYAVIFRNAAPRACTFDANEFLNFPSFTTGGALFKFENTCSLDVESPVTIGSVFKNIGNPYVVQVDTGGNEDNIWGGLRTDPQVVNRMYSFSGTDQVFSFTPPVGQGSYYFNVNNAPEYSGQVIFRSESGGASCVKLGGGANFAVGTGVPTGSTGSSSSMTIFAHTDGKLYIENRRGFSSNVFISPALAFENQGT